MCSEGFEKVFAFPNFSLHGLFQARKNKVAMNLSTSGYRLNCPASFSWWKGFLLRSYFAYS